jgi:hypothetical protein
MQRQLLNTELVLYFWKECLGPKGQREACDFSHGRFTKRKIYLAGPFFTDAEYGFTSDAGTAWEAGYIYATGKESYVISMNKDTCPVYSLMMINGCTKFFNSFDDFWSFLHDSEYKGYDAEVK